METTMTAQRVGILRLDTSGPGIERPLGVTLLTDGFWDGPGWLVAGSRYQLAFDGHGWRVTSIDWTQSLAAHDWRLSTRQGNMVGSLLLENGNQWLNTRATYTIVADYESTWVLIQNAAPDEPAPL